MTDTAPGTSQHRYGTRPTMKDVAARAGVGLKTVSRVVNGEPGVTPDTERRVQEAITALGFRRNDSARILRKGRTASIGLVLEDLADPFYGPLSRAVEEVARSHGALLINGSSAEDPAREQELVLALCARRVDGLVVIPAGDDHRYLEPEIAAGHRHRLRGPPGRSDRRRRRALRQLRRRAGRGGPSHRARPPPDRIHRRPAADPHRARSGCAAIATAMAAAGLAVDDSWVALGSTEPERVRAAAGAMLDGPAPVTALFAGNNRVTVTAVRVLAERPRPVALVGFDDFELADLLQPAITVVAQDAARLGRTAAGMLFRRLEGDRRSAAPGRRSRPG